MPIIIFLTVSFSHQRSLIVFYWSLSDDKSPQIFRTLLSILTGLNYAVVWTVSTRPVISKSSSPSTNPFVTVPRALITIGIIVTFNFHSFFQFPSKVSLFAFFQLYSVVRWDSKVHNSASSFFFVDKFLSSGRV